jgi:hypothetical protein
MSTTCAYLVQTIQQLAPEATLHESAGKNPEHRFSTQMTASKAPIHAFEEHNENGHSPAQAVGGALSACPMARGRLLSDPAHASGLQGAEPLRAVTLSPRPAVLCVSSWADGCQDRS